MICRPICSPIARGFTLVELLVVMAIVAILAAIAIPSYSAYVQRSRIIEATSSLADFRVRMEQFFLDNRRYTAGAACGIADPTSTGSESFDVKCVAGGRPHVQGDGDRHRREEHEGLHLFHRPERPQEDRKPA